MLAIQEMKKCYKQLKRCSIQTHGPCRLEHSGEGTGANSNVLGARAGCLYSSCGRICLSEV